MFRRTFLGYGLALVAFSRRAWAQPLEPPPRFFPLPNPIRIPVDAVKVPWQPVPFTAEAMAPATATSATRRVLIGGVLFRRSPDESPSAAARGIGALSALCLTCPHEQCKVDFITEPTRLARMIGGAASHPLFECGCHNSVFDAARDGARVSGETPRGLYRFRVAAINGGVVEINEVEETALFEV